MTTAFRPNTDGGIEGKHRIVNMAMTAIVDSRQSNWIDCVPHVQFRLNATRSRATGFTPFELTMGYVPTTFPMIADLPLTTQADAAAFVERQALNRAIADDAITATRLKQTLAEDRHRAATPIYDPGARVLLSTKNLKIKGRDAEGAAKWHHRWVGPFSVVRQTGTTVEIALPRSWSGLHPRFHVELLKPYRGAEDRYDEPPPEIESDTAEPEWMVERIVNHRWNARRRRFEWRVQWQGYSPADNTWEPLEHLAGCTELLADYRERHGKEQIPAARGSKRTAGRK
jgi:hypothetical protein